MLKKTNPRVEWDTKCRIVPKYRILLDDIKKVMYMTEVKGEQAMMVEVLPYPDSHHIE